MTRESQKRWDKDNMTTITCRLTKQKAEEFKNACVILGTNRNAVLMKAINKAIDDAKKKSE